MWTIRKRKKAEAIVVSMLNLMVFIATVEPNWMVGQLHYHQTSLVDPSKDLAFSLNRVATKTNKGKGNHKYEELAEAPLGIEGFGGF